MRRRVPRMYANSRAVTPPEGGPRCCPDSSHGRVRFEPSRACEQPLLQVEAGDEAVRNRLVVLNAESHPCAGMSPAPTVALCCPWTTKPPCVPWRDRFTRLKLDRQSWTLLDAATRSSGPRVLCSSLSRMRGDLSST